MSFQQSRSSQSHSPAFELFAVCLSPPPTATGPPHWSPKDVKSHGGWDDVQKQSSPMKRHNGVCMDDTHTHIWQPRRVLTAPVLMLHIFIMEGSSSRVLETGETSKSL